MSSGIELGGGAVQFGVDTQGEVPSRRAMRSGHLPAERRTPLLSAARRLLLVVFSTMLVAGVCTSTTNRIYDERFHLQRADQITRGRPLAEVFTEPTPSAVGPIFPLVHSAVQRMSHGDVRASRLVSLLSMALCLGLVAEVLRKNGDDPAASVLLFCSGPFVVSSVLALTETLALVFGFGAFAVIWTVDRSERPGVGRLAIAAILIGLAILTRQSLAVLALPLVAASISARGFRLLDVVILGTPSILAVLLLLSLWGGLVPPGQAGLVAKEGFAWDHVARALAYCAVMGSLMQPTIVWSRAVALLGGAGVAVNVLAGWWTFPVLLTMFPDGGAWTEVFRRVFWGAAAGVLCGYFGTLIRAAWIERNAPAGVSCLAVTVVAISCGLVTGEFSSRYVVAAVPFLLLISRQRTSTWGEMGGLVGATVGFVLGLVSLRAYGLW